VQQRGAQHAACDDGAAHAHLQRAGRARVGAKRAFAKRAGTSGRARQATAAAEK
jgi:hypothetical protein